MTIIGLILGAMAGGGRSGAPNPSSGPTKELARSADEIPFIIGALDIPEMWHHGNRGVMENQLVPGLTHIEAWVYWRPLEPSKDQWDFREFDAMLALSREKGLKFLVLPWLMYAPEWFKKSPDYTPLTEMRTGKSVDVLSPWAPGTLAAYDHFFAELARRYNDSIDILKFSYPGSDFGEVGMLLGSKGFLPGGMRYEFLPQDPEAWKAGYWCGDRFARADFRERMLEKYGDLNRLNAAWSTRFDGAAAIEYPDPDRRGNERRRWLDFMTWYQETQVRNMAKFLKIIRNHFPDTFMDIPLGYGSDMPSDGDDRTAIIRAAADFKPLTIRSTHGSVNRAPMPRAYWFYKRMAPLAHRLGLSFCTEPPGGDLKYPELQRQYFEDASAGANLIFQYFQNFHLRPNVVEEYKRVLRPQERSLVDIGVLYPSTQMLLDMNHFPGWPEGQIRFCDLGREFFDYDVVDENMIGWDRLADYRVLLHTNGLVYREATLRAIDRWLRAGGILVTCGAPRWEDWDGAKTIATAWRANEDPTPAPGVRVWRVGKGRLFTADETAMPEYLARVVRILAHVTGAPGADSSLHGFDGKADSKWVTEFPDGRLVFDAQSLVTQFIKKDAN
ncbi:MAG: family 14 glycosylhydrolase [bacterium]|nr:family 14 glycosylhydrolase [bacterium]